MGTPPADIYVQKPGDASLLVEADTDNAGEFDHPLILLEQDGGQVSARLTFDGGTNDFLIDLPYSASEMFFRIFEGSGANDWEFQNYTDVEGRLTDLGDLQIDGSVSSPATDLAEYYPLAGRVEPGDVVAFAAGAGLRLERARDDGRGVPRLAGVVSSKRGLLLGITGTDEASEAVPPPALADDERFVGADPERRVDRLVLHGIEANGRAPLALAGRVPCKVSAENGAIEPGDLLGASRLPGHAAKAVAEGLVIGMALEGLEAGTGTIVVLVDRGWFTPADELRAAVRELRGELARLRAGDRGAVENGL